MVSRRKYPLNLNHNLYNAPTDNDQKVLPITSSRYTDGAKDETLRYAILRYNDWDRSNEHSVFRM